jgi:DNA-binding response OmpR family regulator
MVSMHDEQVDGREGSAGPVIVIEDDPSLSQLIVYMLQAEGFDAHGFADGEHGLEAVRSLRPKIVVLDLTLPGLSGDEVCRAIRRDPSLTGTFVLVMTALDDLEARRRVREAGADCYMCKPFDPGRLVEVVHDVLAGELEDEPQPSEAPA